jgi:hypothetical protein
MWEDDGTLGAATLQVQFGAAPLHNAIIDIIT